MSEPLTILVGDCRERLRDLAADSVQCVVTSPPYFGLRDYGHAGQIGREPTPSDFVGAIVDTMREVRRVMRDDGTLWLNIGDSYANDAKWGGSTGGKHAAGLHGDVGIGREKRRTGIPAKSLMGIPWRVALAMVDDEWVLRSDIIWSKPNPMPESVTDRPTKAHEYLFLFAKSERYVYDAAAIEEKASGRAPGNVAAAYGEGDEHHRTKSGLLAVGARETRNRRTVWSVPVSSYRGAHFATFPVDLVEPCVLAGSRVGDTVLDPFAGSGTTAEVSLRLGRKAVAIELNPEYARLIEKRTRVQMPLGGVA